MTSKEIRKAFLDFFASKGHQIVPSAPMVVKNDPTLMFTNAGMNQFKDWFLGNSPAKWKRVADSQKCLRVSNGPTVVLFRPPLSCCLCTPSLHCTHPL